MACFSKSQLSGSGGRREAIDHIPKENDAPEAADASGSGEDTTIGGESEEDEDDDMDDGYIEFE